jgi:hypothetical protein
MQGDIRHSTGLRIGYNKTTEQRMDVSEKHHFFSFGDARNTLVQIR